MENIINCTPHTVTLYAADGERVLRTLPPSGRVVRVKTPPQRQRGALDGVPIVDAQRFADSAEIYGLPERPGPDGRWPTIIVGIVGFEAIVRAYPGTALATDTGPESVVRDSAGQILGVRRLQGMGFRWIVGDRYDSPAVTTSVLAWTEEEALAEARRQDPSYAEALTGARRA